MLFADVFLQASIRKRTLGFLDTGIVLLLLRRVRIEIILHVGPFAACATAVHELPPDGILKS